ncbi:MAG: adenosine kinase [Hyphomicrobiales bacterium]
MPARKFDVVGIGNAIVDVIARTEDDFLVAEGLAKGSMRLIDGEEAERLYGRMGPSIEMSGGSAANTIAGLASFGAAGGFVGKVADDALGRIFAHDIRAIGVEFDTLPLDGGTATARSLILVTPDGERTMNTFLGACQELYPEDIHESFVGEAAVVYLEGYLWDPEPAKAAFRKAADIAHAKGGKVAFSLSDAFCVDRYRPDFLELMRSGAIDILFGNESEIHALYQTGDFTTAVEQLRADVPLAVTTRGVEGSVVTLGPGTYQVPAAAVEDVVDTTGAGDLFAAGFLFGHARGLPIITCAELAALAAGRVISHMGARPQVSLKVLAQPRRLDLRSPQAFRSRPFRLRGRR